MWRVSNVPSVWEEVGGVGVCSSWGREEGGGVGLVEAGERDEETLMVTLGFRAGGGGYTEEQLVQVHVHVHNCTLYTVQCTSTVRHSNDFRLAL